MLILKKFFIIFIGIFCLCLFACDVGGGGDGGDGEVCYYSVDDSEYDGSLDWSSGRIFHPCGIEDMSGKFGATTLSGGNLNTQMSQYWLGEHISSNGMVALALTASSYSSAASYEAAHKAGVHVLKAENANPDSPLYQKIDKIAVAGYSFGGAGALQAASDLGDDIDAAIGYAPYATGNVSGIVVPTLCLAGESDSTAPPSMVHATFENLPNDIPRAYAELKGVSHLYWVSNSNGELGKTMILAWLKYYLSGDESYYNTIINPPEGIINNEFEN